MSIVNGTFGAFINTYRSVFPPTSNVEYQFVMGLLGIVTNISASPEGREFLITNSSGTEFVQKLIKLTPELPLAPETISLKRYVLNLVIFKVVFICSQLSYLSSKNFYVSYSNISFYWKTKLRWYDRNYRLMLIILYNVSMNKTGLKLLLESRVGDVLSHCLDDKASSKEMQLLCLRVLQSITYDLEEPKYVHDLTTIIPIERIETMISAKQSDISGAAKQVVKHLRHSQKIAKWLLKLNAFVRCIASFMIIYK